ncbi:dynactin subunit 1 [Nematostella vectensis]|uniref:dynactin subunit 1 n=1 Tax=Nematostella vectensis TaxID=45351 RepID=UPI0020775A79|nr:dynactin subunit 1 [Nematostella vectensis]
MVQFHNINVGARVEVLWRGEVCKGAVRYTGMLVAKPGEWIGIELDDRVGSHSGLHKGVQYFKCKDGHGIFTRARNIRFDSNKRSVFNSYRTISPNSSVDEVLFKKMNGLSLDVDHPDNIERGKPVVRSSYLKTLFKERKEDNLWSRSRQFHKSHLVGAHIKPATMQRPQTAQPSNPYGSKHREPFITPPSIPPCGVPRPVLKRMMKQNYFGTSIPRYSSLS